jgi:putative Mn2+ efflux pump MntP
LAVRRMACAKFGTSKLSAELPLRQVREGDTNRTWLLPNSPVTVPVARRSGLADQGSCEAEGVLKLLAFVLPLGLDSFAVAAAIGASQATTIWQRLRISLIFVLFEGGMPLIGLVLGAVLARGIGQVADYAAGAAVIAIGAWMLLASDEDEEEKASRLTASRGLALIGLGISISLDELAIGVTIGLAHLPIIAVIVTIALQAFVAAQLGLAVGARIGERWRERAEQIAGVALILLGAYLIIEQLAR